MNSNSIIDILKFKNYVSDLSCFLFEIDDINDNNNHETDYKMNTHYILWISYKI